MNTQTDWEKRWWLAATSRDGNLHTPAGRAMLLRRLWEEMHELQAEAADGGRGSGVVGELADVYMLARALIWAFGYTPDEIARTKLDRVMQRPEWAPHDPKPTLPRPCTQADLVLKLLAEERAGCEDGAQYLTCAEIVENARWNGSPIGATDARRALRRLTRDGLARLTPLFTEEGLAAGSGYGITDQAVALLADTGGDGGGRITTKDTEGTER